MSDDYAPPPAPDGTPSGTVKRADFRPATPPRKRARFPRWVGALLALGGVVIVGAVVTQVLLTARAARLEPADPNATGRLHSAQLVPGMCIEALRTNASPVEVVPCEESHSAEVVTALTLTGDEFPGDETVADTVLHFCASQLAPGGPLADVAADRDWVAWVPSRHTWSAGDRSGLCIVTADAPWTGTLPASADHAQA